MKNQTNHKPKIQLQAETDSDQEQQAISTRNHNNTIMTTTSQKSGYQNGQNED